MGFPIFQMTENQQGENCPGVSEEETSELSEKYQVYKKIAGECLEDFKSKVTFHSLMGEKPDYLLLGLKACLKPKVVEILSEEILRILKTPSAQQEKN